MATPVTILSMIVFFLSAAMIPALTPATTASNIASQLRNSAIAITIGRTKIAMPEALQVACKLLEQRVIEMVSPLDIPFDFRWQDAGSVERSAGCRMHHEKGDRDDQQQGRYRSKDSQVRVTQQLIYSSAAKLRC
jgi:hypothetical protein